MNFMRTAGSRAQGRIMTKQTVWRCQRKDVSDGNAFSSGSYGAFSALWGAARTKAKHTISIRTRHAEAVEPQTVANAA